MRSFFVKLFAAPVFEDDQEKTRTARLLNAILLIVIIFTIIATAPLFFFASSSETPLFFAFFLPTTALNIIALLTLRRRRVVAASYLFLFSVSLSIFSAYATSGSGSAVSLLAIGLILVFANMFVNTRAFLRVTTLVAIITFALSVARSRGWIPSIFQPSAGNPVGDWIAYSLVLSLAGIGMYLTSRNTQQALETSIANRKKLQATNEELADLQAILESRIQERTADFSTARSESERRAKDLQTISEISRIVSSEQRLDILLPLIVHIVSEKFNFYHIGIFLLDAARQNVVLQAANSEGGQHMLARGHRLKLGEGIVGNVAHTGIARIALDVGADAAFFDNPDLPATRSEMALPLNIKGETIGVLDVQSVQAGEFNENNLNTLSVLSAQIAIAIENARLLTNAQQALAEAQALHSQYLQQEWRTFRSKAASIGYHQSTQGGEALEAPFNTDAINEAIKRGELILDDDNPRVEPAVSAPLKLRGETIGVLNVKAPNKGYQWSADEINMIQAVSERLAVALESARLIEETNRRAERERVVAEITGKIRSVNDPQAMIQTALAELKSALGASRVQVVSPPANGGKKDT